MILFPIILFLISFILAAYVFSIRHGISNRMKISVTISIITILMLSVIGTIYWIRS